MDTTSKVTQLKAGFFVLLGLISIGVLVLVFGRFGDSIKKYYMLTVDYRNASGLLKGADVLLAGARIGAVAEPPRVLPNMQGVAVKLKIDESVQIPKGSVFSIGSSGLLGDRFVTVTMSNDAQNQEAILPDTTITNGVSESSIAELQRQMHDEILPKLNEALAHFNDVSVPKLDATLSDINSVSRDLKTKVFNEEGVKNLQATLANFKTTSEALAASSTQIKGVTDQANLFLKKGNNAMDSVSGAAGDLKVFISNLRQHGIIFYRDSTSRATGPLKP
jgi:ABC-type transporter Mla subunit MlaD